MLCECSACSLGARVNMLCVWTGALGSSTAGRCEEGRKVLNSGSRSCGWSNAQGLPVPVLSEGRGRLGPAPLGIHREPVWRDPGMGHIFGLF